ncbi:high-potential iron-sulfur protein [Sphingobium sufflavum]|uniref:high-potential iron-sulfur protein n=1 Tax=Sphingobium sufflavum TaxID=1129547 RepID=UPI001F241DA4|nr:high-potential iron-sulfur protein [Sphingobium sufflavum]MCE7796227.1 high-potential iron-sulfur protein [Sphingobium sufflavum]
MKSSSALPVDALIPDATDDLPGNPGRRRMLGLLATLPALAIGLSCGGAAMAAGAAAGATGEVCIDPTKLPASQTSMRRSLGFKMASTDPKKTCGTCMFFTGAKGSDCGKCALLSGGAVPAAGVCDSWAPKG